MPSFGKCLQWSSGTPSWQSTSWFKIAPKAGAFGRPRHAMAQRAVRRDCIAGTQAAHGQARCSSGQHEDASVVERPAAKAKLGGPGQAQLHQPKGRPAALRFEAHPHKALDWAHTMVCDPKPTGHHCESSLGSEAMGAGARRRLLLGQPGKACDQAA